MESNLACPIVKLPRIRRKRMDDLVEERYERRPMKRGQRSEARRLEEGFRMLNGEGVHEDDNG